MSLEENKEIVRRFYEDLHSGDPDTVIDAYLAEEFIGHNKSKDRSTFKQVTTALMASYPDIKSNIEDIIAENDKVVVRMKINSDKKSMSAIIINRIVNGKIVEQWAHSDSFF